MVVLNKLCVQTSRFFEGLGIEALVEEAALITKNLGFDDQNTGQVGGDYIHGVSPVIRIDGRHSCAKWRARRVHRDFS
ncbi:hypothetical protein D3C81_2270230 [compost metagenome]